MEPKVRLTQKDLVFGIYRAGKKGGLNIWFRGRYVWPLRRNSAAVSKPEAKTVAPEKESRIQQLPFSTSSSPHTEEAESA